MIPEPCICNEGRLFLRYTKNGANIYECNNCDLLTVRPLPGKDELRSFYDSNYSDGRYVNRIMEYAVKLRADTFRHWFKYFSFLLRPGDRLLDIGCGDGTGMAVAEELGFQVYGNDISMIAAKNAKLKWGERVRSGVPIENSDFEKNFFNCITMFDFIEHTTEPLETLKFCHTLLGEPGFLIIATHDGGGMLRKVMGTKWNYLNPDEHLNIFTKKTLRIFLEKSKFKIKLITNVSKTVNLEFIYNEIRFTNKYFHSGLKVLKRLIPNVIWHREFNFYPGEILCVAEKV